MNYEKYTYTFIPLFLFELHYNISYDVISPVVIRITDVFLTLPCQQLSNKHYKIV